MTFPDGHNRSEVSRTEKKNQPNTNTVEAYGDHVLKSSKNTRNSPHFSLTTVFLKVLVAFSDEHNVLRFHGWNKFDPMPIQPKRMMTMYSYAKKNNRRRSVHMFILPLWCHPRVWKTRRSNLGGKH